MLVSDWGRLVLPGEGLRRRRRRRAWLVVILIFLAGVGVVRLPWGRVSSGGSTTAQAIERRAPKVSADEAKVAKLFHEPFRNGHFPAQVSFDGTDARVQYTLDSAAQERMEKLIRSYGPDYAAFVAMDADTGAIKALISYTREPSNHGNLALEATFPSASIFKIVTAAAALDRRRVTPETVIRFTGGDHTLYRKNVTEQAPNRWARLMSVREAFAKSVNTVFGKLGLFFLKPVELEEYAHRFLFNQAIASDLPLEPGTFSVGGGDPFKLAELASGYNRESTMSPVQGALIAATVANDGVMRAPYLVDGLVGPDGRVIYRAQPETVSVAVSPQAAQSLRTLMRETVKKGTGRKSFASFLSARRRSPVDVGGKTGSLTSLEPRGKCDWFVGFAEANGRRLAVAALTVNKERWRVKSSYLARAYFEKEFPVPQRVSRLFR